ncbi:MAG TPA: chemotaxis protein CheB, partial [Chitinophagaceae bacterium]|nr:chemotaxis protein CheB [Chitinophagaceae bacterium]
MRNGRTKAIVKKKTEKQPGKTTVPAKQKKTQKTNGQPPKPFPIAGIGASAGGLEAFSDLLQNLSPKLGIAYVLVQHLSPDHESFLPQILERKTKMKVHQVKDNMPVEKDNVYVIPPNNSLTITDGMLKLIPEPKGKRSFHPIDLFLSSLASVYKNNAIGIILSGTATDGTLGLKAVKSEGGITFAQDETAKYQGMPRYAADMGYADFVMPPARIAKELSTLLNHPLAGQDTTIDFVHDHKAEMRKIFSILNNKKNIDFSLYKQSTIQRRIMRRMLLNKLNTLDEYSQLLRENYKEVDALHQDLLINVTGFFREPDMNNALTTEVFPAILKDRKPSEPIRVWVPGCATGEEAISIAILLIEYLSEKGITIPIQIFATDLNEKAIEKARVGLYSKSAVENISAERLRRFFTKMDGHYQVVKNIREVCIFATHNLIKDPPFSRMDLISCQNVLIYLENAPQQRIMQTFHYALKPSGFLALGKSETIGNATDLFEITSKKYKIYSKKPVGTPVNMEYAPRSYNVFNYPEEKPTNEGRKEVDLEQQAEKLLLTQYVPASVLVNKNLEIIRFRGIVSPFLEPAAGKASLHLMKMVKEEIAHELRTLVIKAKKTNQVEKKEGLIIGLNGKTSEVAIEVAPIQTTEKDIYFLVVFKKNGEQIIPPPEGKSSRTASHSVKDKRIKQLEKQLKEAHDNVKTMSEEFDVTREELQSSNEEVLSSNEELQSINEELETSKEELQSANEELITINEELHKRNTELHELNDYADAMFETMHESLILLNEDLQVRIANKGFYASFQTTPEETEGVLLAELGNKQWNLPELEKQLKIVQNRHSPMINFEVEHDFPVIGYKTLLLNAQRLMLKDGKESLILLAIQDITERKQMETKVRKNEERFRLLITNSFDIITIFDKNGIAKFVSPSIENILGYTSSERTGKSLLINIHPDDRHLKEEMFVNALQHPEKNIRGEFRLKHKDESYRTMDVVCLNLLSDERMQGVVFNYRDISDRKLLEQQKDDFIGIASHELKTPVTSIKAYAQILHEKFLDEGNEVSADMAGKMNAQIDRLTTLINDLLEFTRIEGSNLNFRREEYDLNELIIQVTDEMQRTAKKHKLELKLDKTQTILGDRQRIGEVLNNLLSNAIKYSPDAKKIIISSQIKDDRVTVCIQDFGIGISKATQGRVFDKFYRVHDPTIN